MRFVAPEPVRIHLSNGTDWIEVKAELNVEEEKKYRTSGFKRVSQGDAQNGDSPEIAIDFAQMALARVEAYLTDWSDKKAIDTPAKKRAAIGALAVEDFEEIDQAIQAHIEKSIQEKKAKKAQPKELSMSA
jgi:hypothetical protein